MSHLASLRPMTETRHLGVELLRLQINVFVNEIRIANCQFNKQAAVTECRHVWLEVPEPQVLANTFPIGLVIALEGKRARFDLGQRLGVKYHACDPVQDCAVHVCRMHGRFAGRAHIN